MALDHTEHSLLEPRLLFTEPWDPIVVRRGDALGLLALTNVFAELVAPGLTNRVRDGRWVTIMAWCLVRSQQIAHASGSRSVSTRPEQNARYAWLRPLELMWTARTIALAEADWKERPLPGRRRVQPWYDDYSEGGEYAARFGMSEDQFRAYRQTGTYGAYRVAFRRWPEMTIGGDGWTPGPAARALAKWLDSKLGSARPNWHLHAGNGKREGISTQSAKLGRGEECRWWLQHWANFDRGGSRIEETLPRPRTELDVLPEADLLEPIIFGGNTGKRRREVAKEISDCTAKDHTGICEYLGKVLAEQEPAIALLPRFSRLADAGIAAMDLISKSLGGKSRVPLAEAASTPSAKRVCEELYAAARDWPTDETLSLRHIGSAHRFANAISSADPIACFTALLQHHEIYGGGLRWFVLRGELVEPRTGPSAAASSYRFRLWSLCRLATQCGVIDEMPAGLLDEPDEAEENGL
ncbi:hypothetical protein HNR60_000689 [Rhodopseudomonas rhenobacensis]|uniref:Uncharacterized protein n=1 Tax=Rhodopseudomonas rhenobacensis TaxID=87461 RepID=A0A7W7Z0V4_9BRAD|nr:hypothetical protein [Rhodopseudomonas rhenobacensis]MBB5045954.1 hypothetical protein [Rhodopseudomonas rhenobacensis]